MKLEIQEGFLVETFPRSGQVRRRARLVPSRPAGRVKGDGAVTLDGCVYVLAYSFEPGIRQGRAVAWPKEGA